VPLFLFMRNLFLISLKFANNMPQVCYLVLVQHLNQIMKHRIVYLHLH